MIISPLQLRKQNNILLCFHNFSFFNIQNRVELIVLLPYPELLLSCQLKTKHHKYFKFYGIFDTLYVRVANFNPNAFELVTYAISPHAEKETSTNMKRIVVKHAYDCKNLIGWFDVQNI